MLDFYLSLPKVDSIPLDSFYIKGYTEPLKTYTGVRVVWDASFTEGLQQKFLDYFKLVGTPCYYIPVFVDNKVYGFVLKGYSKMTPRYSTWIQTPGVNKIKEGDLVFIVEGIKDSYLLRKAGYHAIPLCGSVPSLSLLEFFQERKCKILFIPDFDVHRDKHVYSFFKKVNELNYQRDCTWYSLSKVSDLGDFFKPETRKLAIEETKNIIQGATTWLKTLTK